MKELVKQAAFFFCCALVVPLWAMYLLQSTLLQRKPIEGWSQFVGLFPGKVGIYLRRAFYRGVLTDVGQDAVISFGVLISHERTTIGRSAYIGPYSVLGEVNIGDDVLMGSGVSVMNGAKQHGINRLDIPIREQPGNWPRVHIGCDTWIGDRAIVMEDVGKHCVVGAGAVVTKPVPDYAIVVGNPARIVKYRNEREAEDNCPAGELPDTINTSPSPRVD